MNLSRALSRYARPPDPGSREVCAFCAAPFGDRHGHVVDLDQRRLSCVCRPCALLFTAPAAAGGTYRTVPDRVLVDPDFVLDEVTWSRLEVPVRLAFVFENSRMNAPVACYPSPAGPVESVLSSERWASLRKRCALVRALEPDVEALLVSGKRGQSTLETFLVPIDACYELVGLVRRHWQGFDGGDAQTKIGEFLERLRARSAVLRTGSRAS